MDGFAIRSMEKETVSKRDAIKYLPWTSWRNMMETSIFRILKYYSETQVRGDFRLYFSGTASALKASGVRKYRGEFVLNALSQIYGLPPVCKSVLLSLKPFQWRMFLVCNLSFFNSLRWSARIASPI